MKYINPRKVTVEYKNKDFNQGYGHTYYEAEVYSEDTVRRLNFVRLAKKYKKNFLKYWPDIKTVWINVPREIYNHYELQRNN